MATMYPQRLPNIVQSNAERKLFDALRDHLHADYTVIWSIPWTIRRDPGKGGALDGEVDFLLLHPQKGILNVEVKGGGVGYDGTRHEWYTVDRYNKRYVIDPFDQATKCMHTMIKKLQNEAASLLVRKACQKAVFGRAVFFPDIASSQVTNRPIIPEDFVLCREALQPLNLEHELDKIYKFWKRDYNQPIGSKVISEIVAMYAPNWYIRPPLINEFEDEERQLKQLTEGQFAVLGILSERKRVGIAGCAGSGKTFLAVEQARRLARRGLKVLLTCYNNNLADWLRRQLAEQGQKESVLIDNIEVFNFHRVASRLCQRAGINLPSSDSQNFDEAYADGLLEAAKRLPKLRYDAIIADEGQDFEDGWWVALLDLLRSAEESYFYVFYDNNQRIYDRASSYPVPVTEIYPLNTNCRTTKKIHTEVVKYYKAGEQPDCYQASPNGRDMERVLSVPASQEERTKLAELLKRLVQEEKIPPDEIVILSPASKETSRFKEGDTLGGKYKLSWKMDGPPVPNTITCCSIFAFKGLERMVVIVVEPDKIEPDKREQLTYVALSRARSHLIILGNLSH